MSDSISFTDINDRCGNIRKFVSRMRKNDFIVQQGIMSYVDILKYCSEGRVDNCLANNVGAPYACCFLPPAPGQDPSPGQRPPAGYNPHSPNNYPANINYIIPGFTYKLKPDEAVVLIGRTPPPAAYFSFRSYLGFIENKKGKDYTEYTAGNEETGFYHLIFASLGDSLNNFFIWTEDTPEAPFNSYTVIIISASQSINNEVRKALGSAGFSQSIINNDNIPQGLVNMGLARGKDTFMFIMRAALWEDPKMGYNYIHNIDKLMNVFRITPERYDKGLNLWPVPDLRTRETGVSEFQTVSSARDDLDHLRSEIISKYGSSGYSFTDLDSEFWKPAGYEAIIQDVTIYGDNRDSTYFKTENFQLTTDDDFLVVYGVNHELTEKAIYSNASFYGAEMVNGVAAAFSTVEFAYSAVDYFPAGYENAKYYYLYIMARKRFEENVIIIPYSTGNPRGKAYGVDNNQDAFIGFRVYVDQKALVGPALFDIIWDHAILFTRK